MATSELSTPSPPGRANTPPTPKHGYSDNWEQFSPRKSARISSQRTSAAAARTPSPTPASPSRSRNQHRRQLRSPQSGHSPMSPVGSPRKKKMPPINPTRRASGQLTAEGSASAAASLGLSAKAKGKAAARGGSTNISTQAGMLPTPAKTPARKQPNAENEANIAAIARNLFHTETEKFTTPQKKRGKKKYSGITMDSFTVVEEEEPVQIFTDSRDRVPEQDHSIDNPFFGQGAIIPQPDPPKRRSKRNQVTVPGEGRQHIDDLSRREDGMVYVFRGKKLFRKFDDTPNEIDEQRAAEGAATPSKRHTRSSIKPRLLFPVAAQNQAFEESIKDEQTLEDEDAVTDIEVPEDAPEAVPETPLESGDDLPDTPAAPRFAPASPPATGRARRLINKLSGEGDTPVKSIRKRSPFDNWRHTKTSESSGTAHKRSGSSLGSAVPAKRSRA